MNEQEKAQLRRLVDAGVEGWQARRAGNETDYRQALARYESIWENSSPAVRAKFDELTERMNQVGRSRGGRS